MEKKERLMTKRDVLSIAFKILGVIMLMYTVLLIPNIGMAIGMLFQTPPDNYQSYLKLWHFTITVTWPVFSFVMGCILLKWGNKIATRLVKEDKEISAKVGEDWEKKIFILSLRIIGVIWLIRGIPDLIKSIGELIMRWYIYYYSFSHIIGVILGASVSVILGIYLIVGGEYLVELAFRERTKTPRKTNGKRKLCKHCGKKMDINEEVCPSCGTQLSEDDVIVL